MNTENIDKRPKCGWPMPGGPDPAKNTGTVPCGSEERVFNVKGRGRWGYPKETPVCEKHLPEAWKRWNVDSAEPSLGGAERSRAKKSATRAQRSVSGAIQEETQAKAWATSDQVLTQLCHRVIRWIDDLNR